MQNNAIAIIESPLQAMSLMEFCFLKSIPPNNLTIILNLNTNVSVMNKSLIDIVFQSYRYDISKVCYFYEYDLTETFSGLLKGFRNIMRLGREVKAKNYDYILIGEFRSIVARHFANLTCSNEIVFLDDGNAIKRAPSIRNKPESAKFKLKKQLLSLFGYNLKVLSSVTYFSAFLSEARLDYSKDSLIVNKFNKLTSLRNIKNEGEEVLGIVGSPLFAAGVCSEENEVESSRILIEHLKQLNTENKRVVYFPHRRENEKKLKRFESYGIEILKQQAPIELKLMMFSKVKLLGFYSSCFETLPLVYPEVEIESIELPIKLINYTWVDFVKLQYETYSNINNIKLISWESK